QTVINDEARMMNELMANHEARVICATRYAVTSPRSRNLSELHRIYDSTLQRFNAAKPMIRCGIGYDVHRLAEGRKLILGGVEIAHSRGLEGHSDADVLSHAIADALLGAIGAGDIGQHF